MVAWRPLVEQLDALSRETGRKIVFTELGYRSARFGAWKHWEVAEDAPADPRLQAAAYEAFFEAVWPEPWCGVYRWKWFSHLGHSGPASNDFEFEGKPAERVVERYYSGRP